MTADYDIARHATRTAWYRLGNPAWSSQDWEDLIQDAALEVFKAEPVTEGFTADRRRAFLFGAARQAVVRGWLRGIVAHNPANPYPLDFAERVEIEEPSDEPETGLTDEAKREIERVFRAARKQQTGRAVAAAKRDVAICDLLARGYRNQGIAVALNIPVNSVKKYRREIVARLVAEAERRGVDAESILVARRRSYGFFDYRVRSKSPRRANNAA